MVVEGKSGPFFHKEEKTRLLARCRQDKRANAGHFSRATSLLQVPKSSQVTAKPTDPQPSRSCHDQCPLSLVPCEPPGMGHVSRLWLSRLGVPSSKHVTALCSQHHYRKGLSQRSPWLAALRCAAFA